MKRIFNLIFWTFSLLLPLMMTSCSDREKVDNTDDGSFTIKAVREAFSSGNDGARISYMPDDLNIKVDWETGDKLFLYDMDEGEVYTATFKWNNTDVLPPVPGESSKSIGYFKYDGPEEDNFIVGHTYKAIAVSAKSLSAGNVQWDEKQFTTLKYSTFFNNVPGEHGYVADAFGNMNSTIPNATLNRLSELSVFFSDNSLTFQKSKGKDNVGTLVDPLNSSKNNLYNFTMPYAVMVMKFNLPTNPDFDYNQIKKIDLDFVNTSGANSEYMFNTAGVNAVNDVYTYYRFVLPTKNVKEILFSLRENHQDNPVFSVARKAQSNSDSKNIEAGKVYTFTFDGTKGEVVEPEERTIYLWKLDPAYEEDNPKDYNTNLAHLQYIINDPVLVEIPFEDGPGDGQDNINLKAWTALKGFLTDKTGYNIQFNNLTQLTDANSQSALENVTAIDGFYADKLTHLPYKFFFNNIALQYYSLNALESIGDYAFSKTNLTIIDLPNVTTIGTNVFQNCAKLNVVVLNKLTGIIPNYTFQNCISLERIQIPTDNFTEIGNYAFNNCPSLSNVSKDGGYSGVLTFSNVTKVGMYGLGLGVYGSPNENIYTINLPKVDYIGNFAFSFIVVPGGDANPLYITIGTTSSKPAGTGIVEVKEESPGFTPLRIFYGCKFGTNEKTRYAMVLTLGKVFSQSPYSYGGMGTDFRWSYHDPITGYNWLVNIGKIEVQ